MRKLRVGVWVNEDYNPEMGGGFGYYSQIINALYSYPFAAAEIVYISKKFSKHWDKKDKSYQIQTADFQPPVPSLKSRLVKKIAKKVGLETKKIDFTSARAIQQKKLKEELAQVVDVLYYPIPGCEIQNFPYIYTLWDLGHLSTYAFPEFTMNDTFESRKHHHDYLPHKALMVFCESETGKKEAVQYLNLNEKRIKVIPIFPSEIISDSIDAIKPEELESDAFFIHYPAQFWSHKNHYNLLVAFQKVRLQNPNLKLVLSGADKGNKDYVFDTIKTLGLKEAVVDLGFVAIEKLKWIYQNSQGLVMPTFLGPTNMPLLEAAALGCAVCCSDLAGHKEQMGNYAYFFNPLNAMELAEQIINMLEDQQQDKHRTYDADVFAITNALDKMDLAFTEVRQLRFCWGANDQIF